MENPNLLYRLFQCIHPHFWYRNPPPWHQSTPPPHNMDLDGNFEVGFHRRRWRAALKAHQITPLFVERTPLIVHCMQPHCVHSRLYGNRSSPMYSSFCHCRNLAWLWYQLIQRERVEAESVTHNYYNSSTKSKFYKNTSLASKIVEKTSLRNFY